MQKYRELGLKLTPQRISILEYLKDNKEHPSAEEIYRAILKQHPTMSFSTVYTTLEALRKKGRLVELSIDPTKKRFDPDTSPHDHLICIDCKHILDIQREFELNTPSGNLHDFKILGNHIEFYGICPSCRTDTAAIPPL